MTGRTGRAIEVLKAPPDISIDLPGSKSITNRALVAAGLAVGRSRLHRVLLADDTEAMVDALRSLGVAVTIDAATAEAVIDGVGSALPPGPLALFARQSGTTARFLLPVLALGAGPYILDAHPQMRSRPQAPLLDALRSLGVTVTDRGEPGHLPVEVDGGPCRGGAVALPGNVSSQFVSGLLLAGPNFADGLHVTLTTGVVSQPYVDLTIAVMTAFGAAVSRPAPKEIVVAPSGYRPVVGYEIEPDASAASYFFAAAVVGRGRVTARGLHRSSRQGDTAFADVLARMGATVTETSEGLEVRHHGELRGIEVDLADLSDTAPTLATLAPFATGPTRVSGIGFIRAKESDRIGDVVNELRRCGVEAWEEPDGFGVTPSAPQPAVIETYQDHRVAMSFAILGLAAPGIVITDPGCVGKTFPEFWEVLDQVAASGLPAPRVIAIDGPAGSGKSTIARALADRLGVEYLDTGAMYRGIAHAALADGIDPADDKAVAALAHAVDIEVGERVLVGTVDATEAIRGPEVTAAVSAVAANPGVRTVMRERQRQWARSRGGGVLEGRDIGTVVFPDAMLKVYLTASAEERARRRAGESGRSTAEELAAIGRRDHVDTNRTHSPLAEANDATAVDTTGLSIDAVVDQIAGLVAEAVERAGSRDG